MAYHEFYLLEVDQGWVLKKPGLITPFKQFQSFSEAKKYVLTLNRTDELYVQIQDKTGQWSTFEFPSPSIDKAQSMDTIN
jgi:hypothetical protein